MTALKHLDVRAAVERRQRAGGADRVVDDGRVGAVMNTSPSARTLERRSPRQPMRRSSTSADCSPRTWVASHVSLYMPSSARRTRPSARRRLRSARAAFLLPVAANARWTAARRSRAPGGGGPIGTGGAQRLVAGDEAAGRPSRPPRGRRRPPPRPASAGGARPGPDPGPPAARSSTGSGPAGLVDRPRSQNLANPGRHARVGRRILDRAGDDVGHQRERVVARERPPP